MTSTAASPSGVVTKISPLTTRLAEDQQHQFGQAQIRQADQGHHEHQEDQHDAGVADHLLAIGPDDLAQLRGDLLLR